MNLRGGGAGSVVISGITFRNGKYKINSLENFIAENARLKIENNALVVTPTAENFSIIYKKPLKVRSSLKFDFKLFVMIFVCTFLLFYKLTVYLADFKTLKNHSRMDIVFLIVFFLILFVPMFKLDHNEYSIKELRRLAQYQPLVINKEINYNWGNNYNKYFSDHFYLRDEIITFYDRFKYYVAYQNYVLPGHAVLNKKTNWAFRLEPYSLAIYEELSINRIERIVTNIKRLDSFCDANNIKFYLVVVPSKEDIYNEKSYYVPSGKSENFYQIFDELKKNNDIRVIFPSKDFLKSKKENFVFYKTDHHWTDYGAFVGYNMLANEIRKDFPNFKSETTEDFVITQSKLVRSDFTREFNTGQTLYAFLNLDNDKIANKVLDVEYPYYTHKAFNKLNIDINYQDRIKDFYFPSKNDLTAIEIGNSMSENLNGFLPYSFKHLRYYRANNTKREFIYELRMSDYEESIIKMKPDVLILTVNSAYVVPIENMYPEEKK